LCEDQHIGYIESYEFYKNIFSIINYKISYRPRGHKLARKENYTKALFHYQLAQKYYDECKLSPPNLLECIARLYAKLGKHKDALLYAEKSYEVFKKLEKTSHRFSKSVKRVNELISALNSGEEGYINRIGEGMS